MQHWTVMYQAPEESLRLNNVRSYKMKTLAETCNVSSFLNVGITPIIQNLPEKKRESQPQRSNLLVLTQPAFTCSKLTIETSGQCVKSVQS